MQDVFISNRIAGHNEQRRHLETLKLGAQALLVVETLHIHVLLCAGDDIHRDVVVTSVLEHHQTPMNVFQDQIKRKIPVRHRDDGVDRIRVAAPHQITQFLGDGIHRASIIELGSEFLQSLGDQITDPAQFGMTEGIRGLIGKDHLAASNIAPSETNTTE